MDVASTSMRTLARRLLELEAAGLSAADAETFEAVRLVERLRISLTRFAGPDGFRILLQRALAMSRADIPGLRDVRIKGVGRMEGFEEYCANSPDDGADAGVAITTSLLELLVIFIGEPLTRRLVREAWPDLSQDEWKRIETR